MRAIIIIFNKVFVREFYRYNTGFLFLVSGFCFGFMSGTEHKALAQFFVSSPSLLWLPITVWIFYLSKVRQFNSKVLYELHNEFIFHFTLFPKIAQWIFLLHVLTLQLMPAIAYALFLVVIAFQCALIPSIVYISISIFIIIMTGTTLLMFDLEGLPYEKKTTFVDNFLNTRTRRLYVQFFIEWIVRNNITMLLGTKIFSCLMLFAIAKLYTTEIYDWRLLGIGLTLAFSGNAVLVLYYYQFENFHFQIVRNLPFFIRERLFNFAIVFCILCLPEFGILIRYFPENLSHILLGFALAFSLSVLLFMHAILYSMKVDQIKFIRKICAMAIIVVLLILFSIPLWLLACFNLIVGTLLFKKHFYTS